LIQHDNDVATDEEHFPVTVSPSYRNPANEEVEMKRTRFIRNVVLVHRNGPKTGTIIAAALALMLGALFTFSLGPALAIAASTPSSPGGGATSAIMGPCYAIQSIEDPMQLSPDKEITGAQPVSVNARRYVAAWPRAVFDYFSTPKNWPALLDVRRVCDLQEPIEVGSRFTLLLWSGAEVEGTIIDWQEDAHFAARLQARGVSRPLLLGLTIEPVPDGSEVQLNLSAAADGAVRLLRPTSSAEGQMDRYLDSVLRRIKVGLEY
jgi:hypothetical protein